MIAAQDHVVRVDGVDDLGPQRRRVAGPAAWPALGQRALACDDLADSPQRSNLLELLAANLFEAVKPRGQLDGRRLVGRATQPLGDAPRQTADTVGVTAH